MQLPRQTDGDLGEYTGSTTGDQVFFYFILTVKDNFIERDKAIIAKSSISPLTSFHLSLYIQNLHFCSFLLNFGNVEVNFGEVKITDVLRAWRKMFLRFKQ